MVRSKKQSKRSSAAARSETASTTFSTRLSSSQRELIEAAARSKGWSPGQFIREAAIDRAAHVLNLAGKNSFRFLRLAQSLAQHLVAPCGELGPCDGPGEEVVRFDCRFEVISSSTATAENVQERLLDPLCNEKARICSMADAVSEIAQAVKFGGTEFLELVLHECDRVSQLEGTTVADEAPPPIDPDDVKEDHQ